MARKPKETDVETLEILSSIRRIITAGGGAEEASPKPSAKTKPAAKKTAHKKRAAQKAPVKKPGPRKPAAKKPSRSQKPAKKKVQDILVLTEVAPEQGGRQEEPKVIQMPTPAEEGKKGQGKPPEEARSEAPGLARELDLDNALEELVRSMLKEKLQDYLDKHLADIVNKIAAEELARKRNKD
jgi:cell pole-organizing protein PopZ